MKNVLLKNNFIKRFIFLLIIFIYFLFLPNNLWGIALEGRILTVSIQDNFLVLDVGEEENVFKGKKFNVFKNDELVGVTEVLQARKDVAAFDTTLLKKRVVLFPKDILILKEIDDLEATKLPSIRIRKDIDTDIIISERTQKDVSIPDSKKESYEKEQTPLLVRPFKKMKDWTITAGREVKDWFEKEGREQDTITDTEIDRTVSKGIIDIPAIKGIKLETDVIGGRRKVLFMLNEELKNRGFIVTNYSIIEGTIHAQKSLEMSTYEEVFANIKAAIDHKIIYFVTVRKIDEETSHIMLDVSASYKKGNEYNNIEISSSSNLVNEAKAILVEVKDKM